MRSFEIYGKWSVQASKQASKHTHARAQCSHTSVGLAQARPKYMDSHSGTASDGYVGWSFFAGRVVDQTYP